MTLGSHRRARLTSACGGIGLAVLLAAGCAASDEAPTVPFDEPTIVGSLPTSPSLEDMASMMPTPVASGSAVSTPEEVPAAVHVAESATLEGFKRLPKADQISYATWVLRDYEEFLADYNLAGGTGHGTVLPAQSLANTPEEIETTDVLQRRMILAQNDPEVRNKLNYALHIEGETSADLAIFQQYLDKSVGDGPGFSARVQAVKGDLVRFDAITNKNTLTITREANGLNSVSLKFEGSDTSVRYVDFFFVPLENNYMPGVSALWIPK